MTQAICRYYASGQMLAPTIASIPNRSSSELDATLVRLLTLRWRVGAKWNQEGNVPRVSIGRRIPLVAFLRYLGSYPEWRRLLKSFPVLQVVSGSCLNGLPIALSGRRFVLWVATSNDGDLAAQRLHADFPHRLSHALNLPAGKIIERYVLRRATKVLALSSFTANELIRAHGLDPEDTFVVSSPVDTEVFCPPPERWDTPSVIWVARHTDPRKDTAMLARSFIKVHRRIPNARLILVGDRPQESVVDTLRAGGALDSVDLVGPVPHADTARLYRRASVFAMSSLQEGLGIVGLEAMAAGLPVVSTRCGGPEDYVKDSENGFLVDIGDDERMARRLILLLERPDLRAKMGRAARGLVKEQYTFPVFYRQMDDVYRSVWPELYGHERAE